MCIRDRNWGDHEKDVQRQIQLICNNHIIKSIHGHDAFLIETNQISDIFTKILK